MPGDIGYSQLQIRDNLKTKKKLLAWMTGGGVLTYELDLMSLAKFSTPQSNDNFKRLISEPNQDIIRLAFETFSVENFLFILYSYLYFIFDSYPQLKDPSLSDSHDWPIGICLTEFHLAIFYRTNIKILCLHNKETVLSQKFDPKVNKNCLILCLNQFLFV